MEFLPLSEPVLLILLSLAGQPRHGYSILKDVEQSIEAASRLDHSLPASEEADEGPLLDRLDLFA